VGSLLLWYRLTKFFELGILNSQNRAHAVCLKTFVTTDLQKAICEHFGVRCVETLTGFKYIGAKLRKYEQQIPEAERTNYTKMNEEETRALRLSKSSYYVFGGEESYGYSGADFVRDKDANGAALMLAELAAFAREKDSTLHELLDDIFRTFGFYLERSVSLSFEGAEGASKIRHLMASYVSHSPSSIAGSRVINIRDFSRDTLQDEEGDPIPKESMMMFETEDRCRIAIRPSGTEPKIKYYLFATQQQSATKGNYPKTGSCLPRSSAAGETKDLPTLKKKVETRLDEIWKFLDEDAKKRINN
jgi:phosphoglucomutase